MAPAALRQHRKRTYTSDADLSGSDYLSESEISDAAEDEYQTSQHPKTKKKQRVATRSIPADDDVELFKALSIDGVAITDLALNWLETIEDDTANGTTNALTEMFNLILRCCGCVHLAERHDLASYDSAAATVAEVGLFFKRQKTHEYPFVSKGKDTKFFRRNVTEFFETAVELAHEKGLLFQDNSVSGDSSLSSPMMNALLAWLFALSGSDCRPFRYVVTSLLHAIQGKLCKLAAISTVSVEKQQRQLASARNNRSARNRAAHDRKIDLIAENLRVSKMQRDAIVEYLGDIFQNVFNTRYRDIDSTIRADSLRALALWALLYGDMFLQANYLRYFGWMLSDPDDQVKKEALKSLHKLYKNTSSRGEVIPIGLHQLTENFQSQILNMLWLDSTVIKPSLFGVYSELTKLGFLDEADTRKICLYGYFLVESAAVSSPSSSINLEFSNYIAAVCGLRASAETEKYARFLSTHESSFFGDGEDQLEASACFNFKALIELLQTSYSHYCETERPKISVKPRDLLFESMVKRIVLILYSHLFLQGKWEVFLRYILLDTSLVQFSEATTSNRNTENSDEVESALKARLSLATRPLKHTALSAFAGMTIRLLTDAGPKKTAADNNIDDLDVALPILVVFIPKIEKFASTASQLHCVYLNIWNSLLVSLPSTIAKLFSLHSSVEVYNKIQMNIMDYFLEMETDDEPLGRAFETYFGIMAQSFESRGMAEAITQADKLLNTHISIRFEDLLVSLVAEASEALLVEEPDLLTVEEDIETDDKISKQLKVTLTRLLKVLAASHKLSQIAKSYNLNRFVGEPAAGFPSSLLEVIQVKLLTKINMQDILDRIPSCYMHQMVEFSLLWNSVLEFLLLSFCWSLEDLTYASGDSSASVIDIGVFLADYADIIPLLFSFLEAIQSATKTFNNVNLETEKTRNLVENLVSMASKSGLKLCDMLCSLRTFFAQYSGKDIFRNFDSFFETHQGLKKLVLSPIPTENESALLNVFLVREASVGKLLEKPLERAYNEDVNIDDYVFINNSKDIAAEDPEEYEESDRIESIHQVEEDEGLTAARNLIMKQRILAEEEQLCLYTLKLLVLDNTGALSKPVSDRLRLNACVFGELFSALIGLSATEESTS